MVSNVLPQLYQRQRNWRENKSFTPKHIAYLLLCKLNSEKHGKWEPLNPVSEEIMVDETLFHFEWQVDLILIHTVQCYILCNVRKYHIMETLERNAPCLPLKATLSVLNSLPLLTLSQQGVTWNLSRLAICFAL